MHELKLVSTTENVLPLTTYILVRRSKLVRSHRMGTLSTPSSVFLLAAQVAIDLCFGYTF